ncbi:EMB1611/MEE22 [Arabidopsis lyrata subsp. lyrata]|uniref:EMB1611/MEE22 n=2 Tax=Arabidopsis lyrata subsp. lyrata TaxID=81972 RepID=D7LH45_ARALL|nr:uncharacterized protein LOC9315582 isoform X1 [Arabidopsis lyrata subsp. lyrata]EFH55774.1 EMB1611/MEE22 [Arabidopsis lyrata subsp. lyrata]|eukprot:XP_002879515.1 uncharacterized protein LOC9315582 isoform X1 [Arabidopsis lyrata subsp. lyrata]
MAAANAPPELASGNPCCVAWQGKYIGMKKRRDAFREAVTLLQKAIADANTEKSNLEKKLGEMAVDRDTKANDSTVKASFEKEISGLKSEILSLQQQLVRNLKEKSEETKLLQDQASRREKEINELKDLLKKETLRADNSEEEREHAFKELNKAKALIVKDEEIKPHVPEVRKEISLVKNLLASERQKTESERKKAESEKKKADQYLSELEVLRTSAHKTSSDLLTLTSNLETIKKQLELEKQKTLKEKKRADTESAKARDQMKLAEGLSEKFEIVKARNEELMKEMESQSASSKVKFSENSEKLEEKIRLLEMNKKSAMDWKSRADDLTQQLQEAQLVTEGLKKQVHELSLSQKSIKTHSISPQGVRDLEKAEMRLLKKKLKFERNCAKHSETVAKFEKFRREFQGEELGRLKLEFGSLTNRMNLLNEYFSRGVEGTAGLEKATGCRKLQTLPSQKNRNGEKHSDARCNLVASSGSREQACKLSAHLISKSGRGVSESGSGTISQLESPTGGSRKLQSSGVISSETSFSDGQLLASQGREQFSVTTSAEIAKDKPNIQPTKSSMFQKISDTSKNGNLCLVAENYLQRRQRDSHEVVDENSRKRKRMLEAVVSRKHLSSDDKKKNLQIGEKMSRLQSMVLGTGSRPLEKEETLVPDRQGGSFVVSKKRRVSCKKKTIIQNSLEFNQSGKTPGNIAGKTTCLSTAKGHDVTTLFPEDVAATDYMKLLELDNLEEENYYQMARESLLSPDLPQVDFLGVEIVNDKNPARALDMAASNSMCLRETILSSESPSLNTLNDLVTPLHGHVLKHFVVFSNIEDQKSIIKIFHATNNCVQRCPSVTREQWAVPAILSSLKMEENLLAQERVCVFLSLLLHNFSMVPSTKISNTLNVDSFSCLDSFSKHIYGVMADTEAGVMLSEFSEELLSLLQDLLSAQRVLFSVKSSETSESDLSISVTLNGGYVALVNKIALIDHLVAGSAILAAICTALDRIGYICEASFEILHKYSHEKTSVLLTILHVFAYIAGEKMLLSSEHDISIAVLKSIVMFLENKHFGTVEDNSQLHPGKNKCPFADRSSSLEALASKLMEILQEFTQSNTLHQSLTGSLGSSHLEKTEFRPAHKDFQCVLTRDQSVNLCDILSLVELIACYTAWDWTSANIVAPLLKILGMPLPMNLSVAIVSLLGQLSSVGVDAGGYENKGISNLRAKLSAFLQCETTLKAGFAVQIATVSSLLKTLQLKFPIDFQDKTTMIPGSGDQSLSGSVNVVTKWLSLLSNEQRVFAFEFLQISVVR